MRVISDRLAWTRTFLSADVFPIAFIATDDQGIGQRPEVIMPYVDYFSPMVYPSHYYPGVFDIAEPNEHPYEMIDQTLEIMNAEAAPYPLKIRPWLQDFGYGEFRPYTAADIEAEMQAAADNGTAGWMIWNAQRPVHDRCAGRADRGRGVRVGHQRGRRLGRQPGCRAPPRLPRPMRLVVQRVSRASVHADGDLLGRDRPRRRRAGRRGGRRHRARPSTGWRPSSSVCAISRTRKVAPTSPSPTWTGRSWW